MSSAIRNGTLSAPEADVKADVSARREAESRAGSVAEAETRAARFRAALGSAPGATGGDVRGLLGKAGDGAAAAGAAKGKPQPGAPDRPAAGHGGRSGAAGTSGEARGGEAKADKVTRPPGLTDEQALAVSDLSGGPVFAGAGAAGKKKGGGSAEIAPADDAGIGPGVQAGVGLDAARNKSPKSAGEEVIAEVAAAVSAAAQLQAPTGWTRPEGPTRPEPRARELPQPMPGVDPIHQLLIGKGPNGAEARMRISVGPLAGTEIHLREGPGGVQAAIVTQNASSRQTLTSAMEAVAQRLKDKGHKLDVRIDGRASDQRGAGDQGRPPNR